MPVIDHPVHKSTIKDSSHRYGCWNKSRDFKAYYAPQRFAGSDGYKPVFRIEAVRVEHKMSKDCRYDMSITDPCCSDCVHRGNGESYFKQVAEASK